MIRAALIALLTVLAGVSARAAPALAIDDDFPDPTVIRAANGWTYAYATQGGTPGAMRNIQLARSRDLHRWERIGDALPVKPAWAARTQDFWAPHVVVHDGTYFLYFSAKPDAALTDPQAGLCLGVATARTPQGPFTDSGQPLQCGPGFVNIDPMAFDDPATGKRLLYWGSGFGPIKVRELASDRVSFAPGSVARDLVFPDGGDYRRLVEGAWLTRHGGSYYLFFSGDNCCGKDAHYATMVARSASATGPFTMLPEPVLAADARWLAPGHNAVMTDARGRTWTFYHAIDRQRTADGARGPNSRRVMLVRELVWRHGVPVAR